MQPYFFPYIGYWQLMNLVDTYVIFDDVNYINRGWIDRNRIIVNGQITYLNLPVLGKSQNKHINEINVNKDRKFISKTIKTIELAYKKSPNFAEVYPLFTDIMNCPEEKLSLFIKNSFEVIANYLGIKTKFVLSSQIDIDRNLKGQDRILAICKKIGATEYINAIGGMDLYSKSLFKENNINLYFLESGEIKYKQICDEFQPNLSIIDVLMNCSISEINGFLNKYTLI